MLLALLFFGGGGGYTVHARFINAGQLVTGSQVDIGGVNAGTVKGFEITDAGQVDVELEVDEEYEPLRVGTRAVIRQNGLGSPASRYVQLMLPSENEAGGEIPDGGRIPIDKTTTNVELDQFFSIFDRRTRQSLRDFYKGGARQYAGRGAQGNRGFRLPEPAAGRIEPPVRGADPRRPGARALPRGLLALRHGPGRAPRRPGAADREPERHDARARRREARAGRGDRAASAVHAPGQHHLREPALHARRARPVRRGVEARGAQAASLPRRAAAVRARGGAGGPRPGRDRRQAPARTTTCSS